MPVLPIEDYHVGIICALHTELAAARGMLDEEHGSVTEKDTKDHNTYFGGRMHNHNVVIACLPAGVDGLSAAATVAKDMLRTFKELRFGLLVGIGGGIPNIDAGVDVRLGDVVVSQPCGVHGGVIQYDKGKSKTDGQWERKGMLNRPPTILLTALQSLQAEHKLEDSQIPTYLADMLQRRPKMKATGYGRPDTASDLLFSASFPHMAGKRTCEMCDMTQSLSRPPRSSDDPQIHYGVIASGNQVIKDPNARDNLRYDYDALCVEMEAAGLMNDFPCVVIRGICDYADSHKNDAWHRYAAATAAAYAKELLLHVSSQQTALEKPITAVLG